MSEFIYFIFWLFVIFLLSQNFLRSLFIFFFLLTNSKNWSMRLTAILLLPGTILHELSHWLTAELLHVPTGAINFLPRLQNEKDLQMGSVAIAKTDPFRRTVIGIAPTIFGLSIITFLTGLLPQSVFLYHFQSIAIIIIILIISSTMFSSDQDLKTALIPLVFIITVVIVFWWFKFSIPDKIAELFLLIIN